MVRTRAWLQNVLVIGCLVLFSVATPQPVHIQASPEEVSNTTVSHLSRHTDTEEPLGDCVLKEASFHCLLSLHVETMVIVLD